LRLQALKAAREFHRIAVDTIIVGFSFHKQAGLVSSAPATQPPLCTAAAPFFLQQHARPPRTLPGPHPLYICRTLRLLVEHTASEPHASGFSGDTSHSRNAGSQLAIKTQHPIYECPLHLTSQPPTCPLSQHTFANTRLQCISTSGGLKQALPCLSLRTTQHLHPHTSQSPFSRFNASSTFSPYNLLTNG